MGARRVGIDECQMAAVGYTEFFALLDASQRSVDDELVLQVALPADVLVLRGMVENRSETENNSLGLDQVAVRIGGWPVVRVVVERCPFDVLAVFSRV